MRKVSRLRAGVPVKDVLCATLSGIKSELRRNLRRQRRDPDAASFETLQSAKDILQLGRLMANWKSFVGENLFQHSYPARLMKGNLQVICADSQWLQTFQFFRNLVREKITARFPDVDVKRVYSRIGAIPEGIIPKENAPWPNWQAETADLPSAEEVSTETGTAIVECRKKLSARKKALEAEGYILCPGCRGNLVRPGQGSCSVCVFRQQERIKSRVRELVFDLPWLDAEKLLERLPDASPLMIQEAREDLLHDCFAKIGEIVAGKIQGEETMGAADFHWEVLRYLVLKTGLPPQDIDLEEPFFQGQVPADWLPWLIAAGTEQSC